SESKPTTGLVLSTELLTENVLKSSRYKLIVINATVHQTERFQQVAFSAALTNSDETLGPSERDVTLIFKHVVTNIGNAYNPHTGFFTAPVRGAYHFEWHIGDIGGRSPATAAALVKNSERVFSAYANLTPSHFETSSESATLQLEAGDVVSVNKWATSGIYDNVNHHVTFSGHLLFTM
uniref:C1q domain-containing protein n=1 Tax=Monopterus albus TaxID=43700 RepID=A0A3Q3KPK1_MONAL